MRTNNSGRSWIRYLLVGVVVIVVVAPVAVSASHQFTDVPDSNVFHSDIGWLADAGITTGCNPPAQTEFCPTDNVTRQQMAAFMRRLAVYMDAEDGTPAQADHATTADDANTLDGKNSFAFLEYGGPVPALQTIVGSIGNYTSDANENFIMDTVSFPVKMPGELTINIIAPGGVLPTGCFGDVNEPGAVGGNLCVFIETANGTTGSWGAVSTGTSDSVTSPYGAQIWAQTTGTGTAEFYGTWAATAPLTFIPIPLDEESPAPLGGPGNVTD